jgi:hypothetical protein
MEINKKNVSKDSRKSSFSTVMYAVASVVGLIGVSLLINNYFLFQSTVSQAVAQGYAVATVRKALLTSQLLPGIFEPVGIYGGIAFLIFGVGVVNKKVSRCLMFLDKVEDFNDIVEESIVGQNVVAVEDIVAVENIDATEQIEAAEPIEPTVETQSQIAVEDVEK